MYVVAVDFVIRTECIDAFREAVIRQAENSLEKETECLQFDVCEDPSKKDQIFLYEIYTDEASFQAHLRTPHFQDFNEKAALWVEEKTIRIMNRVWPTDN